MSVELVFLIVFCVGFIWFFFETKNAEEIKEDETDNEMKKP